MFNLCSDCKGYVLRLHLLTSSFFMPSNLMLSAFGTKSDSRIVPTVVCSPSQNVKGLKCGLNGYRTAFLGFWNPDAWMVSRQIPYPWGSTDPGGGPAVFVGYQLVRTAWKGAGLHIMRRPRLSATWSTLAMPPAWVCAGLRSVQHVLIYFDRGWLVVHRGVILWSSQRLGKIGCHPELRACF
jgi:hypothetical protein